MSKTPIKVALVGNPNSGKTSLFNQLTGLNQKVANFPGVTVDKKIGLASFYGKKFEIIDLPGTYSLYPKSLDEQVVSEVLLNKNSKDYPDLCLVTVDSTNLKRHLLLLTQIIDLEIPTILVLNMIDEARKQDSIIDIAHLKNEFGIDIVEADSRNGEGIDKLKEILSNQVETPKGNFYSLNPDELDLINNSEHILKGSQNYEKIQQLHQYQHLSLFSSDEKKNLSFYLRTKNWDSNLFQVQETLARYEKINTILLDHYTKVHANASELFSNKIDKILTHKIGGYLIFFIILFALFQSIFSLASYPMDWIDEGITLFKEWVSNVLPSGTVSNLITEGVISGIGGVVIFIPQIALLFAFVTVLEETGYMARVTFIMDKLMRKVGLNGKSVVPLVSGVACAVPAILSARTIDNWKDRIITIFVTPLVSCSARIPVYTILIALVIPDKYIFGFIQLQGLVMFGLYMLGFSAAFFSAFLMKILLKNRTKSFFIMELPVYRWPRWQNVGITIIEKVKTFVYSAGKVILAISIVLWVMASYGGKEKIIEREVILTNQLIKKEINIEQWQTQMNATKLEFSYAGQFGKTLEPVIKPLGFDWKIGIALITSFAAREVFVGTMATIFSIGDADETTLKNKMALAKKPDGTKYFTLPMGLSLLVFYALAMQCMSTLAVTYRETKGWKWPILQTVYMTGLAYVFSFIVFTIFS